MEGGTNRRAAWTLGARLTVGALAAGGVYLLKDSDEGPSETATSPQISASQAVSTPSSPTPSEQGFVMGTTNVPVPPEPYLSKGRITEKDGYFELFMKGTDPR